MSRKRLESDELPESIHPNTHGASAVGQAWGAFTDDVYLLGLGTFFFNYVFTYLLILGCAGS